MNAYFIASSQIGWKNYEIGSAGMPQ